MPTCIVGMESQAHQTATIDYIWYRRFNLDQGLIWGSKVPNVDRVAAGHEADAVTARRNIPNPAREHSSRRS